MTKVNFIKSNNIIIGFKASGHANYNTYNNDIVCSSITTAIYTSLGLLMKLISKDCYHFYENANEALIEFEIINYQSISGEKSKIVSMIFENLNEVLENIHEQYPKNLIIKWAQ